MKLNEYIEITNEDNSTNTAINYSECYQQCFCSDNLELMKTIESNTIDLIYCDILYGTGRKFADYQDLKPIRSEIEAHYIPRINEMHRILKDTGSIYLQMDTKINHWIRCVMDDIFGYDNFVNEIIWCYTMPNNNKRRFNAKHDNIFSYSKTKDYTFNWQSVLTDYSESSKERGKYGSNSMMGKADSPLSKNGGKIMEDWMVIHTLKGNSKEYVKYPTQKPKALIERIIKASSNEGDLVADFYLGSGTTAEVCKDLNRNFIGCDINPRAVEITLKRLNDAQS
jgi:DNA modification methylase